MSSRPLLEVRSLSRSFGKVEAVRDVSFNVEAGQVFGFIGPNGAGKTTTMRMLATLDIPDGGDAWVDGQSVLEEPRAACMRLGFMADHFVPYPNLHVSQFLDFMARAYGLRGRKRTKTIAAVVDFCGLGTFLDRPTTGLSKGMGQRLHLAKTLLHDPGLLVLDEPTAGLDPRARVEFRDLLGVLADEGKGILISSHLLSELAESCDGVVVIEQGQLVVTGAIGDIAKQVRSHSAVLVRVVSDAQETERFLLTQPLVREVRNEDARIGFEYDGSDEQLADLLARLIASGARVSEFRHVEASLEEIFLRTTAGRLQ
ncbi:MAG: ATP-binding cassette domain-containing protein [Planctomycetota bacterium]